MLRQINRQHAAATLMCAVHLYGSLHLTPYLHYLVVRAVSHPYHLYRSISLRVSRPVVSVQWCRCVRSRIHPHRIHHARCLGLYLRRRCGRLPTVRNQDEQMLWHLVQCRCDLSAHYLFHDFRAAYAYLSYHSLCSRPVTMSDVARCHNPSISRHRESCSSCSCAPVASLLVVRCRAVMLSVCACRC